MNEYLPFMYRKHDPETSKQAAEKFAEEGGVESHEQKILRALRRCPMTAKEIENFTGLSNVQISRRLKAMNKPERLELNKPILEKTGTVRNGYEEWRIV